DRHVEQRPRRHRPGRAQRSADARRDALLEGPRQQRRRMRRNPDRRPRPGGPRQRGLRRNLRWSAKVRAAMKQQLALPLRALVGVAAALLLPSVGRSQNAWLVGTYPGSQFVTLQEAIESPLVKPRDALFVFAPRPSGPVTTNKPLTLLGLQGAGFPLCPLTVRSIPRGERFEIIGGSAASLFGRDEYIHFEDCEGQILLSRVGNIPMLPGPPSILFRNCPRVSINQCSLHEAAIIDSTVRAEEHTSELQSR